MGRKRKSKATVAREQKERMRSRRQSSVASIELAPLGEEELLARRLASPCEKNPSNAQRLEPPLGSLSIQSMDMPLSSDSPPWVCTPPRVPSPKLGVAGQTKLVVETSLDVTSIIETKQKVQEYNTETILRINSTEPNTRIYNTESNTTIYNTESILEINTEECNTESKQEINNELMQEMQTEPIPDVKTKPKSVYRTQEIKDINISTLQTDQSDCEIESKMRLTLEFDEPPKTKKAKLESVCSSGFKMLPPDVHLNIASGSEQSNNIKSVKVNGSSKNKINFIGGKVVIRNNKHSSDSSHYSKIRSRKLIQGKTENEETDLNLVDQEETRNEVRNLEKRYSVNQPFMMQGSFHQGDDRFRNNSGKQCVANSLTAIAYSKLSLIDNWNTSFLDKILIEGNILYTWIHGDHEELLVTELPKMVEIRDMIVKCNRKESIFALIDNTGKIEFNVLSLDHALQEALIDSDGCFVCVKGFTSAIIRQNEKMYLFDSHARNCFGLQDSCGKSVVIQINDVNSLYQHFYNFVQGDVNAEFEVTGINIEIQDEDSATNNLDRFIGNINKREVLEDENNSDVEFIGVPTQTCYLFNPIDYYTKRKLCNILDIKSKFVLKNPLMPTHSIGTPLKSKQIIADGNCLFRAISYAVSNRQENFKQIRNELVRHILCHSHQFNSFLDSETVNEYMKRTNMIEDNVWGTELEIIAAADLLKTDIFTYLEGKWIKYSSKQICSKNNVNDQAIYLNNVGNHYEVVLSVLPGGIEAVTLNRKGSVKKRNQSGAEKDQMNLHYELSHEGTMKRKYEQHELNFPKKCLKEDENSFCLIKKKTCLEWPSKDLAVCKPRAPNQGLTKTEKEKFKYQLDGQFRFNKIEKQNRKYEQDRSYRESKKRKSIQKYANDIEHNSYVRKSSIQKYADDDDFKSKVKQASIQKYADDDDFKREVKQASIQKYADDDDFKREVKQASIQKYADDDDFKREVKRASIQKYADDDDFKREVKRASIQKYADDDDFKREVKRASIQKYADDDDFKREVKRASIQKYADDDDFKREVKRASIQKYADDDDFKREVKRASIQKYADDDDFKREVKRASIQKYADDDDFKREVKRASIQKYADDDDFKSKVKDQILTRRKKAKEDSNDVTKVIENFRKNVSKGPEFVCSCCFRLLFENQVVQCKRELYKPGCGKDIADICISEKYLHRCSEECKDECLYQGASRATLWICYTCHRKILKGKIPAESFANNLALEDIPLELNRLNQLEQHLISLNIPFMKIVALPKGGQKAVHGPCVCVPSDISKITTTLPRSEDDNCLVKVKLKRKLQYKGYEEYQFVDTKHLEEALSFLKEKNDWYSNVEINGEWLNPIPSSEDICVAEKKDNKSYTRPDRVKEDNVEDKSDKKEQEDAVDSYLDDSLQGVQLDTCLQPADIAQEALDLLFDQEFNLSPAEGNNPVSLLKENGIEAKTFPVHYPTGKNTWNEDREEKLSLLRYFNLRLMSVENRFARDTSYIFFSQYMSELDRVMSNVQISLRKGSVFSEGQKVTSKMLCNKESLNGLFRKDEAIKFMKPVRGTPPYWQSIQKDIFCMIRQLGIPSFFASFSSADFRWKEIVETILKQQGDIRNVDDLSWDEKCKVLCSNPATVARMFDHRFHKFLKDVIMSDAEPIGHVIDYFYRVEFQQRGSPHTHCVFWIEDAPKFGVDDDDTVTKFIDKYISCKLPLESDDPELTDIVKTVQQHSKNHSKSCRKKGTECRFNFPRPPSEKTFISRPIEDEEDEEHDEDADDSKKSDSESSKPSEKTFIPCPMNHDDDHHHDKNTDGDINKKSESKGSILKAKQILACLWVVIKECEDKTLTTSELFLKAGLSQEDFQECFRWITNRNTVVLKRNKDELFINQYNPHLLKSWNANMDIQYILDAYSCVVYIISYISKSERELGLLLQQTKTEAADGNLDAQRTMKKVGTAYFHFRELSTQEAVFRVIGLRLKECSRKVQFIPLGENPCRMSIPLKELQQKSKTLKMKKSIDDASDDDDDGDSDDIWLKSITDRYKNRPDLERFDQMCLATFCSEFSVLAETQIPNKINEDTTFKLKNDMGYIRKRTRTSDAVIKYARFSVESAPEQYYQSILQLFLPYRLNEQLKPPQFLSYADFYNSGFIKYSQMEDLSSVQNIVNFNMSKFVKKDKELEIAEKQLEERGYQEDAWAQLCPETEKERHECNEVGENTTTQEVDSPELGIPDLNQIDKSTDKNEMVQKTSFSRSEVIPLLRTLNEKQKRIFFKIREWCNLKVNGKNPPPFHVFVTGGAGTGKSHLIKCLYYEATRILAHCSPNPDDLTVLLTAPTGTAAFNINGLTIHSSLSIFKGLSVEKAMLGEDKLNSLRSKLENLQILIIDEVSMVNKRLLFFIHERLRQIKKRPEKYPYGGVSVIAVGDFYQLPPVKSKRSDKLYVNDPSNPLNYLWNDLFSVVELDEVMRQREDSLFAQLLNRLRVKQNNYPLKCSDQEMLKECIDSGPDEALHIYATNNEINMYNNEMIMKLSSEPKLIEAQDFEKDKTTGKLTKRRQNFAKTNICLPTSILLAEGARVMMIKNEAVSDGLVNGVMGTVLSISEFSKGALPKNIYIHFDNDRVGKNAKVQKIINGKRCVGLEPSTEIIPFSNGTRKQYPLQLAWACTVHKVQGLTVQQAVVCLNKCFAYGQAYVALSRVTSKNGLTILPIDDKTLNKKIYSDPDIKEGIKSMDNFLSQNDTIVSNHKAGLSIVYHNIQGLKAHQNDLKANSDFQNANYICLTETWLESCSDDVHLPNYKLHHLPRSAAFASNNPLYASLQEMSHGGVGVYVKLDSEYEELDISQKNLECIIFKVPKMNVLIATIYRTQKYQIELFLRNVRALLSELTQLSSSIIVLGDFNQDIMKGGRSIQDFMASFGFEQLVQEATTEGGTLIDHVYIKSCEKVQVSVIPTYYSYHDAISVILEINPTT
ncbi:uncharacterized protein LOC134717928 [Mytilus trossulus]|uniref:uncharacterized protein LOC134717928 n=1 Tax=Mytilus trossulus TaxID=6551 RepID=UPI003007DCD4